jgi:hypothetical protein
LRRSISNISGGSWQTVREADYTYYVTGDVGGNTGDLQTVVITNGTSVLDTTLYRYYTQANPTNGYLRGLKYVFNPASYERLAAAVGNPTTASDSTVAPFADNYFEYGSQHRVSKEIVQGEGCSSCSGGLGIFEFDYVPSSNTPGYNSWAMKTIETLPDFNENIVYTNYAGQMMLKVYHDTTTGQKWATHYAYDNNSGRLTKIANPSAVAGYDDTQYADLVNGSQYIYSTSGLITEFSYYDETNATATSPGEVEGYLSDVFIRNGLTGDPVPQSHQDYFSIITPNKTW